MRDALPILATGLIGVPALLLGIVVLDRGQRCRDYWEDGTQANLNVLHMAYSEYCVAEQRWPRDLADVHEFLNTPLGAYVRDQWGRSYLFVNASGCPGPEPCPLDCDRHADYCIGTFGSDGRVGGEGDARDRWLCGEFDGHIHDPGLHEWTDAR